MITYPKNWKSIDIINNLQRRILLASMSYYEYNENFLSDDEYDSICRQLMVATGKCNEKENSRYWYVFKKFTGETGFFLFDNLTENDKRELIFIRECYMIWRKQHEKK